jgi:hypothetical protein
MDEMNRCVHGHNTDKSFENYMTPVPSALPGTEQEQLMDRTNSTTLNSHETKCGTPFK